MTAQHSTTGEIHEFMVKIANIKKPETTKDLIKQVQEKYALQDKEITAILLQLETENKIHFTKKILIEPTTNAQLFSREPLWFWLSITIAIATAASVFTMPENDYPLTYLRQILGSIFILFLPGFVFLKMLYPSKVPVATSSENLDTIERIALSIGLSIALTAIAGLILNYAPWGIRLMPITISLLGFTLICALIALLHEYPTKQQPPPKKYCHTQKQLFVS